MRTPPAMSMSIKRGASPSGLQKQPSLLERLQNLTNELKLCVMEDMDAPTLRCWLSSGEVKDFEELWVIHRESIFKNMQRVQYPEFQGMFGDVRCFEQYAMEPMQPSLQDVLATATGRSQTYIGLLAWTHREFQELIDAQIWEDHPFIYIQGAAYRVKAPGHGLEFFEDG